MSSRVYFMKSGKDFKDVSIMSKHKHTKCEHSRRNSDRLQLSQLVSLY